MPYIKQETRKIIDSYLKHILDIIEDCTEGDLNYIITRIVHQWIKHEGLNYKNINSVIGVLECAKMELYRMIAAPYEDKKKKENGSISELDTKRKPPFEINNPVKGLTLSLYPRRINIEKEIK